MQSVKLISTIATSEQSMTNLVTSWLSLYPSLEDARDAINAELGLHTASSRVRQWRDGKHPIPQAVQDIMRRDVITNYNEPTIKLLIEWLALPERK